jgi:toxin ParE1/3/4
VKASVLLTERFLVTIADIAEALATTSTRKYAERVTDELIAKAQSLTDMPRRGRVVPEVGDEAYRELVVGQHRLIYRTNDDASVGSLTPSDTTYDAPIVVRNARASSRTARNASMTVLGWWLTSGSR